MQRFFAICLVYPILLSLIGLRQQGVYDDYYIKFGLFSDFPNPLTVLHFVSNDI